MRNELLKGLTDEQIKKVGACKNSEEILALAKAEGVQLNEEQLGVPGERGRLSSCIWNLGFFPTDARKNCPFVWASFTGWSSERCPGIGFLSRGDREIGVLRLQARILEWIAISFTRGSSQCRSKKNPPEFVERLIFHRPSINGNSFYWYSSSTFPLLSS